MTTLALYPINGLLLFAVLTLAATIIILVGGTLIAYDQTRRENQWEYEEQQDEIYWKVKRHTMPKKDQQ